MLQNPSKYHPNPFSHFLALHNSQAVAHNIAAHHPHHALPVHTTAYHQQQPQLFGNHPNQQQQHQQTTIAANQQQHQLQSHLPLHPQNPLSSPHSHAQQLIDAANTSLDVGKSFTIAAILGLQKSAIEHSRKEYSDVINLSLHHQQHTSHASSVEECDKADQHRSNSNSSCANIISNSNCNNNNDSNNDGGNGGSNKSGNACNNNSFHSVNNFNCDSVGGAVVTNGVGAAAATMLHRYLPPVSGATTAPTATSFGAVSSQQQQNLVLSHVRAVATAAAAAVNGGAPTALQSLQQLHQHHAVQHNNLSFQRDKHKAETNAKKSALKNKRVRTIFTPEQLERLEAEFERQQYMVGPERLYLAHTLQLTEAQVKVWFQNRRIKWRKHHLEITQQRLALLRQSQLPPTTSAAAAVAAVAASAVTVAANMPTISHATTGDATTTSSPLSCDDEADELMKQSSEFRRLSSNSRPASESDLSICNDSMDADSLLEEGEDT